MTPSEIRQARASRARRIRLRVVAGALSLFLATWVLIGVVLISGNDPALAARKTAVATVATPATTTTASTPTTTTSGSSPTTTTTASTPASTSSSTSSSAVTTKQS